MNTWVICFGLCENYHGGQHENILSPSDIFVRRSLSRWRLARASAKSCVGCMAPAPHGLCCEGGKEQEMAALDNLRWIGCTWYHPEIQTVCSPSRLEILTFFTSSLCRGYDMPSLLADAFPGVRLRWIATGSLGGHGCRDV